LPQISGTIRLVSCPQEGRFAIVTNVGAGCDGRLYADDERHGADGEVVSFWRPDAGVKLAAMLFASRQ
jgi:hypothetical protein